MGKKILIITSDKTKHQPLAESISSKGIAVSTHLCSDLAFCIDGDNTQVNIFSTGEDIRDFDKILVLSTPEHSRNYILSALACYCRKYSISIMDDVFTNTSGKLYALWRFWEEDIPVAKTAFGPAEFMIQKFAEFGGVCILKSTHGTKGKDSYLIHSKEELQNILEKNSNKTFILQNFIPNDGDWRIILIDYVPKLAIYRSSHGKDFRNNTSVGGDAKLVPIDKVDPEVIKLAIHAAKAVNIRIAGADILQNSQTKDYSVLEVNRTPQLATGSFVEAKTKMLKEFINS